MKKINLVILLFIVVIFFSCGEKRKELENAIETGKQLLEGTKNIESKIQYFKTKQEERIKRGDTLVIPYKELEKYLPTEISGYKQGDTDGSTITSQFGSFSQIIKKFSEEKAGTVSNLDIELWDYNASGETLSAFMAPWSMGLSFDSEKEKSGGFDIGNPDVIGYEHYDKVNKTSEIFYSIAGRFLLRIYCTNQDNNDFAKSIGNQANIPELCKK